MNTCRTYETSVRKLAGVKQSDVEVAQSFDGYWDVRIKYGEAVFERHLKAHCGWCARSEAVLSLGLDDD